MKTETKHTQSVRPFVSVIIPVFNHPEGVKKLLNALKGQTYPKDLFEVLVVDNGSSDATPQVIRLYVSDQHPVIRFLEQRDIRGSYAARNVGLREAAGDVIAFTDADCEPVADWITRGVEALLDQSADLAGGKVTFTFASGKPTAAERIDARTNMQMEQDIQNRGVAKTANLFSWKKLFDAIGAFRDDLQSGGDVEWTRRATQKGFKLVYVPDAEIRHPARSWIELFAKQVRVGRGQILQQTGKSLTTGANVMKTGRSLQTVISRKDETFLEKTGMLIALVWARLGTLVGRFKGTMELARKRR